MKKARPLPKSSLLPEKSGGFDLIEMMVDNKSMIRKKKVRSNYIKVLLLILQYTTNTTILFLSLLIVTYMVFTFSHLPILEKLLHAYYPLTTAYYTL